MLRVVTRELRRRRCVAQWPLYDPGIYHRSLSNGLTRRFSGSQDAAAERITSASVADGASDPSAKPLIAPSQRADAPEQRSPVKQAPADNEWPPKPTTQSSRDAPRVPSTQGGTTQSAENGLLSGFEALLAGRRQDAADQEGPWESSIEKPITTQERKKRSSHVKRALISARKALGERKSSPRPTVLAPQVLLTDVLERNGQWKSSLEQAASSRSSRVAVVLLQKLLHTQPEIAPELVPLLPKAQEWEAMMQQLTGSGLRQNGFDLAELDHWTYIIGGSTDQERCERFLENDSFKPEFLLRYLLRPTTELMDVATLDRMLDFCAKWFDRAQWTFREEDTVPRKLKRKIIFMQNTAVPIVNALAARLSAQCLRSEPRLLIKFAEVMTEYIRNLGNPENLAQKSEHAGEIYRRRCIAFNATLRSLRPLTIRPPPRGSFPNSYVWEAQQTLLNMSSTFEKPLMIDADGFRAIREVLAGQAKDLTEVHSASRQAPTWPPFLAPGDGLDETSVTETNWSRTVQAGMMMQEAGFPKRAEDEALDILQGMAPDGTPTIQLRTMGERKRRMRQWEASIRATRNAQEAWRQFQSPPEDGMEPESPHYGAMFEKLHRRVVDTELEPSILPGDKAVNFPVHTETNLAEFEQARLQPPSVAQLYEKMLKNGIMPEGSCLRILVAYGSGVAEARQYLLDANQPEAIVGLITEKPEPELVRQIPLGIFSAYIQMLCRIEGIPSRDALKTAIRLLTMYASKDVRFAPFLWGVVLNALAQNRTKFRITIVEQLELVSQVLDQIEEHGLTTVPTFMQLSKVLRKAAKRQLPLLLEDLSAPSTARQNPVRYLYDRVAWRGKAAPPTDDVRFVRVAGEDQFQSSITKFLALAERLKAIVARLVDEEKKRQSVFTIGGVPVLHRIVVRRDPVLAEHAYSYMQTMAHLGEYEEMERQLRWLIQEWGQPEVRAAIQELDHPPPYAELTDTLCLFRLLAEPFLESERVDALRESIAAAELEWYWPDDEMLGEFLKGATDDLNRLERVGHWIRHHQMRDEENEPGGADELAGL